uniref:Uncharacterized protein n=1 Tax=Haptolina brevifila TaxID=156173 RepID=A0A7S2G8U4_9EUKA|mmetsp:Transcript_30841/g.61911  ORF Transcript_30841/g.61911 Transcript_30841/m.61911 type:complete len:589 (+) Transcript_30841:58-1824(+)
MPTAIKGDHGINGINALRNPDASTRPRGPSTPLTPLRKTPSPKPASPTPKPPSPIPSMTNYRASKTPTPPPPPMLLGRAGPSSDRRSPKLMGADGRPYGALSPQSSRGSNSPTEGPKSVGSRLLGHARSMSASSTPAPTPIPGSQASSAARPLIPERQRSKSQASERERVGVGAEARRPDARRPPPNVETVDRSTQTEGEDYDANMELGDYESLGLTEGVSEEFLSKELVVMTELEMAVRSQMERLAGHEGNARAGVGPAPGPAPPSTGRGSSSAHFHGRKLRLAKTAAEANSDGEDAAGPDDEVRSLALSEDGPVVMMKRSISEPLHMHAARSTAAAPDPIAMLTGGERKGTDAMPPLSARSRSFHIDERWIASADLASERERPLNKQRALGEFGADIDGEPLGSDHSAPNDSDKSAARTYSADEAARAAVGEGHVVGAPADEEAVLGAATNLIPLLEKVTAHSTLEVVQEGGASAAASAAAAAAARKAWKANARHVPAVRKDIKDGHALDLSDLRVKGGLERAVRLGAGPRSFDSDANSEVSFGSAQSAFECYLSPSTSQFNSPRGRSELKATVSMPSMPLAPHKR